MTSPRFLLFSLASTMKMSKSYATASRSTFFITRFSKKWLMKFDYEENCGLSVSITFAVDNLLFLSRLWVFILFSIFCCRSQTFYDFFFSLSSSFSNLYRWFHCHFLLFSTKNNPGIFLFCTHTLKLLSLRANYVVSIVNYRINLLHLAVLNSFPQFFINFFLFFFLVQKKKKKFHTSALLPLCLEW